ncbi:hypothetical protein POM88_024148 [Heracleum sosnowskyi]|uniref:Ionotropic glutamate receptor C-terminal domain-containing protein n=1 Tax=Heracleum sosnowskyi TaxID=360622 RepID=A0AAD8MM17_9APIA|nr:hypothetical protein POM88_024148 [Heracleum sosnowskyi]
MYSKLLVEALPYEVPFEFIPSPEHYSNLVYQIYLENFNTVVGDISITAARLQYVDFTIPYTDLGVGTIARVKTNKISVHQIGTIFFSTLFFNNGEKLSSNLSRFVILIWAFLVLILTSSYTATLASMLTVQQIGLISKGANVGYQVGSFREGNIVNNYKYMDCRLLPYSSAEQYADALSKGGQNGGIDGIIDEIPYIKAFLSKYSPDYSMVDSASTTNGFGFASLSSRIIYANLFINVHQNAKS